jgi:hypothetical protein
MRVRDSENRRVKVDGVTNVGLASVHAEAASAAFSASIVEESQVEDGKRNERIKEIKEEKEKSRERISLESQRGAYACNLICVWHGKEFHWLKGLLLRLNNCQFESIQCFTG